MNMVKVNWYEISPGSVGVQYLWKWLNFWALCDFVIGNFDKKRSSISR